MNSSGGDFKKGRGASRENKSRPTTNLEAELNIPAELRLIIDDEEDEFPLRFKDANELMEIFSALEENNLLEIIRM